MTTENEIVGSDDDVEIGSWEILKFNDKYEIYSEYPYPIRKIKTQRQIGESENNKGYIQININCKPMLKHRLIGLQWIPNHDPVNKKEIDHIDRNKLNNRIENLRWASRSDNTMNRKRKDGIYYAEIPETAVQIMNYLDIQLDRYFYDPIEKRLYMRTGMLDLPYKLIVPYIHDGLPCIAFTDVDGKNKGRGWNKFINHMSNIL